ncbi:alpha/beta hydrolase [Flavobacterium cupreum]|uniref:Alpha/beta hydrolase n=1 Tax=Flavobacterium cupreum TaxID=2133766 RepID=A0A434A559_9FLAO|nr:alpha/beta hydrolase [Flavobacterium cupreum]RUT69533.1 alpha/beta hydrolase [Flavobacterium cupreum]
MTTTKTNVENSALGSVTQYAELEGRTLAYRSIGKGAPLILSNRFRGTLDTWDPLFLDSLAENNRVITFDYTGIGYSTGTLPTDLAVVAEDVKDLALYLKLEKTAVLGWSWGGLIAQVAALSYPGLITNAVVIGSVPLGKRTVEIAPAFLHAAVKPLNDFDDEIVLFYEPKSQRSIDAAKESYERISKRLDVTKIPSTMEVFQLYFQGGGAAAEDKDELREKLKTTAVPILVISGDNDISAAVENWFPLLRDLPTTQLIILPHAGHGPQHQEPLLTAGYIKTFLGQ